MTSKEKESILEKQSFSNELKYNINGVFYTKQEIKESNELKKELLKICKYEKLKEYNKLRIRELRKNEPEKYKELSRNYMNKRYKEDIEFREQKKEKTRQLREKKALLLLPNMKKPRGRPHSLLLDDNLNLINNDDKLNK